jgi:hypothetical protein
MLGQIKDICDTAYAFYGGDLVNNSKYISQALSIQGLQNNWDVIMTTLYDTPGFSGHSVDESWWVSLKPK